MEVWNLPGVILPNSDDSSGDFCLSNVIDWGKTIFILASFIAKSLLFSTRMKNLNESLVTSKPLFILIIWEDISILFVQPKGASSAIRILELDDEGQLLDPWPGGFFEEGFRERFS